MTIHYDYEAQEQPEIEYEELLNKTVNAALDYEECPYEVEVSVLFTEDDQIQEINREFREIDKPTDVLSFPAIDYQRPGYFEDLEERCPDCFHPETGELILGDIVVSVQRARMQAQEYGHSMYREVAFLIIHSMLHLMGYDHMEDGERMIMEEKQEAILQSLGITR